MKSPTDISRVLATQWHQAKVRSQRLLRPESWPLCIPIGKPSAQVFAENVQAVQRHVEEWRQVRFGHIEWTTVSYRAGLAPIAIPTYWCLRNPSEWVAAASDCEINKEYTLLETIVEQVDAAFRPLLVSQRALWLKKSPEEVVTTVDIALRLKPGCAKGRPLRLLAEHGVDTKFFERNATLLTKLLDERFDGEASEQGLTTFLDAVEENGHWVLIAPLAPGLLPFQRMRVATTELAQTHLSASRVLVVENEQCIYQLPELTDTVAVLGAGLDLEWLASSVFETKSVGYWGDMDTWGLLMLARARSYRPGVAPLLMNCSLFEKYAEGCAVIEPVRAQNTPPEYLTDLEEAFYRYLLAQQRGRLEQEYLPTREVHEVLARWHGDD